MKKKQCDILKIGAATLMSSVLIGTIALAHSPLPGSGDGKPGTEKSSSAKASATASVTLLTDEDRLVQQLERDGLISQVKGFLVEKNGNELFIDRVHLHASVAQKYTTSISKQHIRVQVHSFGERLKMHPDAGFIQLLLPVSLSSPCVDNSKKPGC